MGALLRKTLELVRAHRVLWAPYAIAELLAFLLITLRRMSIRPILMWFSTTTARSVLGGETETINLDKGQHKAIFLGGLLENGTHYVNACLLTAAMILTASLVVAFLRGETPDRSSAVAALRPYTKRILLFALKFCIAVWVLTIVIGLPFIYLQTNVLHPNRTFSSLLVGTGALLITASVAWIIAPVAIALLRSQGAARVDDGQKRMARYVALLTALTTSILQVIVNQIDSHLPAGLGIDPTVVSGLATLVINAPTAVLFTAFALIAVDQAPESEGQSGLDLREVAKRFMPLHFPPDREPDHKPNPGY